MTKKCFSAFAAYYICLIFVFLTVTCDSIDSSTKFQTRTWDEAIVMAKSFVSQLTLEEKCNMTSGIKGPCVGNVVPISRLNFDGLCFQDAPAGVGDGVQRSTAFPAGIQVAATWDRDLFYKRAVAIGKEFRGKGVHFALGPMMNIDRNARHGRNWEGFGSDPYLSGENAFYFVQGVQDQGVVATAKHFICNEQETHRSGIASSIGIEQQFPTPKAYSADVDDKTIHEIYLWPFASSVSAGVGSVMCSYNQVNNTPACQNQRTLNELLKGELAFLGNVMSDWGATKTGIESVLGGLDIDMPGGDGLMGMALVSAVQKGTISQQRIDDMIIRLLAPYFLLGQDQGYPSIDLNRDTIEDHSIINRQISSAGMILLKNTNNILPFNSTKDNAFAIYGEAAGQSKHGFNGGGFMQLGGAIYQGGGSGYVEPTYALDPLSSILMKARDDHLQIRFNKDQLDEHMMNATQNFRDSTNAKCLVFISAFSTEGVDRVDLLPADDGDLLVKTVAASCTNTVVIVNSVSQLNIEPWIDHPNVVGVIWSGMPGTEYGPALVDILFGDYNPGGKLVFTLAKHDSDYGTDITITKNSNYTEGVFLDYRHFDKYNITPRYHFGYGLSYTTFSFSQIDIVETREVQKLTMPHYWQRSHRSYAHAKVSGLDNPVYEITFTLTNTGHIFGSEVPQLYLGFPAEALQPKKVLRGFERVYLAAGQSKQISLILRQKDISYWNVVSQNWNVAHGTYTVWISTSANDADIKLQTNFTV